MTQRAVKGTTPKYVFNTYIIVVGVECRNPYA
jgi:hypothetical protein